MPLPSIDELLDAARTVVLPLTTRFRGVTEREIVLLNGPRGWSEFSPFTEYPDAEAATWLRAAIEFGWTDPPSP
ncbi:MAG TPA: O-succinylbenzoate synthase, partial [Terrimesophilobacter sp.]|nr:O-succinylbenzoate synthase [Terrimesophilobacter sp.]